MKISSPLKTLNKVQWRIHLHQTIVPQQMSLGSHSSSLKYHQMVLIVDHPESEHCHLDTNLDGGVQTAWLLVVEVSGDAGSQV